MRLLGMLLVLVLVGCGNRAPSCKEALDKAAKKLGDDAGILKELLGECERSGWTAEQRSCLANATDKQTLAACALMLVAEKAQDESRAARKAAQAQQEAFQQAQDAMTRAQAKLEQVAKDLEKFDARLMMAQDKLLQAQNDADRAAAEAKLAALRKEKAEIEAQLAAAKAEADSAARAVEGKLGATPR